MENVNIIRTIRYASENGLVILSFILDEQDNRIILQLQNTLSTFSLTDYEIIISRSLFDLSDAQHRIYNRDHITANEQVLLDISLNQSIWIHRRDYPTYVQLNYEWL